MSKLKRDNEHKACLKPHKTERPQQADRIGESRVEDPFEKKLEKENKELKVKLESLKTENATLIVKHTEEYWASKKKVLSTKMR